MTYQKKIHVRNAIILVILLGLLSFVTSCLNLNKVSDYVKQHPESKQVLCDPCLPSSVKSDTVIKIQTEYIQDTSGMANYTNFLHQIAQMECQQQLDSLKKKCVPVREYKVITKTVTIHDTITIIDNLSIQKAVSDRAAIDAVELEKVKQAAISPAWKYTEFICWGIIICLICVVLFMRWAKKVS